MPTKDVYYIEGQKRVALMQPTFMPWLGYFGLIHDADEFIFLDDFQFVRRSFHQRNSLFLNADSAGYISVPVEHPGKQDAPLNTVKAQIDPKWQRKFLSSLTHNYMKSERLSYYRDFIEDWIGREFKNLAEFNMHFIRFVMEELKINTPTGLSSEYQVVGQRSEKITTLLDHTNADVYLSARGSFEYMDEDNIFESTNIKFLFQNFQPAPYPQAQSAEFVPYLSVLDSLIQQGPKDTLQTIKKSAGKFFNIKEMKEGYKND